MSQLANFVGYQAVWFIAVLGAGRSGTWPALGALALYALCQLASSRERRSDLVLLLLAVGLGTALDGTLAATGLLHYAASSPALPPGGAPLWILALWAAFALTLNHSLAWLRQRRWLALLLGAVGGPLAYGAAERLASAVVFAAPRTRGLAALALGWGLAIVALTEVAARLRDPATAAAAGELRA
jgi:hypothetical protein